MAHQMSALLSISKLRAASAPAVLQFDRGLLDDYPPLDWFETVPDTLLIDIFGFVYHLLDLHRCAIVCRRWNSVVRWEQSNVSQIRLSAAQISLNAPKCPGQATKFNLVCIFLWNRMLMLDLRATQHGRCDPSLVTDDRLIRLLRRCPLVKDLNLSGCGAVTDVSLSEMRCLHRLKFVNISGCAGISATSLSSVCHLRFLEHLDMSDLYKLDEEDFRWCLSRATRLESLIASNVENFGNSALASVTTSATRLTRLDVSQSRNISAPGLQQLSNLTALITLDISGVTRVDATTWQSISQLQKLEVLRIKTVLSSSALSRGFASVVLPALPALSHLSLGYCYFNGRLSAAISQCSRLDSLQVSNQHHFGADDFKPFSHLTKLTFSHSTLPAGAMKYLINIDSLNLDFCLTNKRVEVSERGGGELATKCKTSFSGFRRLTTLKRLSLKACHLDDSMLRSIALASRLQSLQLSSLSKASLKGVRQVRKLKYLQTLDVSNNALLDDKAVANLAPHLGGLVDLVAANCRDLGDIAADAVSVFCPLLKNIVLFRTKITDEGIHSLARLKSLLLLDVSCCERVTTSSLYVLRAQAPRCHVNASHLEAVSGECAPNSSPCSIS